MTQTSKLRESIDRHRSQGRGRKAFWILVLGVSLVAAVGSVRGFGHERGGSQHAYRVDRLLDHLDATDTQRARITALVDERAPELVELATRREALRGRIVEVLAAEELTVTNIETLQQEVREQSAQLAERTIEITFEIASELTPEQRTELIERWTRR
jgi:Spy/CpxP family protein refolding chaperone